MQETITPRHRPLGVTIIAVVLIIQAIFELIIGILAIVAISVVARTIDAHGHATISHVVDVIGGTLGGISLVVGLLTLIFAIGLWMLKRWAFWLTVIIELISVIRHLLGFVRPHPSTVNIVIGLLLPVIILLYFLVDSNVRRAFRI